MIKSMAEKTYNSLYHMPPNAVDLKEFAEQVLNKFIDELIKNKQGVAWNSGFDGVIFVDKSVDGNKSLMQIKEEFLGHRSNEGDSTIPQGTRASGDTEGHQEVGSADKLAEST